MLQAKVNVKSESEIEIEAITPDQWGTCIIRKKEDPAGFELLSTYDKQPLHIAGDGYGSACGNALYGITIAAIYAPAPVAEPVPSGSIDPKMLRPKSSQALSSSETKESYIPITIYSFFTGLCVFGLGLAGYSKGYRKISVLMVLLTLVTTGQSSVKKSDSLCQNCGRMGYKSEISGINGVVAARSSYCSLLTGKSVLKAKKMTCSHSWVPVTYPEKKAKSTWFTTTNRSNGFSPIIFKSEADFYHAACWISLGKDQRANYFVIRERVSNAMNSALEENGRCYEIIREKQKDFARALSLPVNDSESEAVATQLEHILTEYGHVKPEDAPEKG